MKINLRNIKMKYISIFALVIIMSVSAGAQSSFFGMTYDVSVPLGDTKEYTGDTQWRGFGLEGRWFTNKSTSLGFSWDWNVFHDVVAGTEQIKNGAVSGIQNRTINAFPFLVTGHYYLKMGKSIKPYVGLGIGTYYIKRQLGLGIYALDTDKWHFGFAPEIGLLFPFDLGFHLHLKLRYNYALAAGDVAAQQYIGINIGFASIELF